jgi:hypothetical protein
VLLASLTALALTLRISALEGSGGDSDPLPDSALLAAAAAAPEPGDEDSASVGDADAADGADDLPLAAAADSDPAGDDGDPDGLSGADAVVAAPVRECCWTAADTLAALSGASPRARCIVRVEVGGVGWNPYAIGRQGERGVAQLHPRGLYPDFLRQGYTDAFNPYQSVAYLESALQRGLARHWAGVRLGMC